ncbi:MAG: thiol-disulfide oxidoreductase DCC family protein, partial [Halothiobacillaceae bacterium]
MNRPESPGAILYYDAACGLCRREIEHLRPRLAPHAHLVDISAPDFTPPQGYSRQAMQERIHFHDGTQMLVGFAATLAYWRLAGMRRLAALPGVFHCGDFAYNRWAAWRLRR